MTTTVDVPRTLPPGFDHPHASEQARAIAEEGTILRAQVGSGFTATPSVSSSSTTRTVSCRDWPPSGSWATCGRSGRR